MKLLTWNINGLRATKQPIKEVLDSLDADIICLQETKVTKDQLESDIAVVEGYSSYFSFSQTRQGYSGVATYCKDACTPVKAQEGLFDHFEKAAGDKYIGQYGNLEDMFANDEAWKLDREGRTVITQHEFLVDGKVNKLTIINVYCPRADPEKPERKEYKMEFYRALQERARAIEQSGSHVIICGDINTSHHRIDHCDPDGPELFYDNPFREWLDGLLLNKGDYSSMTKTDINANRDKNTDNRCLPDKDKVADSDDLLQFGDIGEWELYKIDDNRCLTVKDNLISSETLSNQHGDSDVQSKFGCNFIDTFRYFFPTRKDAFTCWHTITGSRQTNYGTRIDYIFADYEFHAKFGKFCDIHPEIEGSDHCPVKADFDIEITPSPKCPPCCTKYMQEFGGKQQRLSNFFTKKSKSDPSEIFAKISKTQNIAKSSPNLSQETKFSGSSKTSNSTKRKNAQNEKSNATASKKSKSSKGENIVRAGKQSTLNFFASKTNDTGKTAQLASQLNPTKKAKVDSAAILCKNSKMDEDILDAALNASKVSLKAERKTKYTKSDASAFWKSVLKGPEPSPLCTGHNEPSLLRTVKKEGANLGKQFYVCCRPEGHKTNPEARCNFFQWKKKK